MNPLTFQFKRAHWSAVKFGMAIFRGTKRPEEPDFDGVLDMTPARFDILYLIHKRLPWVATIADLRRQLGVAWPTISRAIKRLAELGLVEKARNGRYVNLRLTPEGRARIRRALYLVFTGRKLVRHIRHFFVSRVDTARQCLAYAIDDALDDVWWLTHSIAEHLGDSADVSAYLFRRGANRFEL